MAQGKANAAAAWLVLIGVSTLMGLVFGWRVGVGTAAAVLTFSGLKILSEAPAEKE